MADTLWDLTVPSKPVGIFDPDSTRIIPFNWANWLTTEGTQYASHQIIVDVPLEEVSSMESGGIIYVKVRVAAGQSVTIGQKYAVTCRLTAADGQIEDQTVYLKMRHK